jgi:hypothetical protein
VSGALSRSGHFGEEIHDYFPLQFDTLTFMHKMFTNFYVYFDKFSEPRYS